MYSKATKKVLILVQHKITILSLNKFMILTYFYKLNSVFAVVHEDNEKTKHCTRLPSHEVLGSYNGYEHHTT